MIDVIILGILYFKFLKKKNFPQEKLKGRMMLFTFVGGIVSLSMYGLLMFPVFEPTLPSIYNKKTRYLHTSEEFARAMLIRFTPALYPVWGPYFLGVTYLRSKDSEFLNTKNYKKHLRRCKKNDDCRGMFQIVHDKKDKKLFFKLFDRHFTRVSFENKCKMLKSVYYSIKEFKSKAAAYEFISNLHRKKFNDCEQYHELYTSYVLYKGDQNEKSNYIKVNRNRPSVRGELFRLANGYLRGGVYSNNLSKEEENKQIIINYVSTFCKQKIPTVHYEKLVCRKYFSND